ncbi:glycosyltransferase family 2 protein [Cellvibrio japonicus]|uniref:Glycosyl transferase, putative, gt2E n=1 Tax=Cellvibrio japonicus (strain Ueda107) TaxID=498211 RepID=B3PFZ6_CELJU|nr:glycosyltransferase family 2 protein [Cellvibrio japonicus]ACE85354.1 glycosyl transferase, putative, gt2E [Cellvibrio japonicus Ueda107]QEI13684.1 glycosyltransferase family 2 protein [Cellvibrio japonicus]QEI17258.1 glycosyltransferase family 2 protein [Cellvibrio japonicus]QEI20835.1 glycosyltransferase family 2 protein [Cellvibrio japonicus]
MFKRRVDADWYLSQYPDVANSGISAEEHYKVFGKAEGRLPRPPRTTPPSKLEILLVALSSAPRFYGGILPATRFLLGNLKHHGIQGFKGVLAEIYYRSRPNQINVDYSSWIALGELNAADYSAAKRRLEGLALQPCISFVLPTYNSSIPWLKEAIDSLKAQPYQNWELCIADDASTHREVRDFLAQQQSQDSRIKVVFREKNGHISESSNSAAEIASGDWIALFDHDDLLHPFALYWILQAINNNPDAQLIYSDEDKIDEQGNRHSPYFKPDWNYDLFLSQNCFSHLGLIRRSLFEKIHGFRKGYEGSQDHDLILRAIELVEPTQIIHIPKVLYHWRVHADSTAKSTDSKPYAAIAGEKAIQDHLLRINAKAQVSFEGYGYRVKYKLPDNPPLVSLIIPTRNGLQLIRQCIDSIQQKTTYPNYEIIVVDNGSDDPEALTYFDTLKNTPRFKVIRDNRPFNYSQLNNLAVKHSDGEIIGLINNDVEVIRPEWLNEMVVHALRPGVGAVGAKLLFPDERLQHGGVVLGIGGVANHAHLFIRGTHHGYFARASVTQQFSAVTAACLVIRKAIYQEVDGLDEQNLAVAFNDVDFCIRVTNKGYRNIWTPYALLYHHESATRGADIAPEKRERFVREVEYMMSTWKKELANDPFYNPNLNLNFPDFSLHSPPRLGKWELSVSPQTQDAG